MENNSAQLETVGGVQTAPPIDMPKSVEVQEVTNGFTISLRGGNHKNETGLVPYRNDLYIASTTEEVIEIVKKHLA